MSDPQIAMLLPIAVSIFCSMVGVAIAIFAAVQSAKQPGAEGFDFAASARRIRSARY